MYHFTVIEKDSGNKIINVDRDKYAIFSLDTEGNIDYFIIEYLSKLNKINIYMNKDYNVSVTKDDEKSLETLAKGKKFHLVEIIKDSEGSLELNFGEETIEYYIKVSSPKSSPVNKAKSPTKNVINPPKDYYSTEVSFKQIYDKGYLYYKWVTPQDDPDESGYFEFLYQNGKDESKTQKITVDITMLGKQENSTEDIYDNVDNIKIGKTTFNISNIPVGSSFKWSYTDNFWIYKVNIGKKYFKIPLIVDIFIYTFEQNLSNKTIDEKLLSFRLIEKTNDDALNAAMNLKNTLSAHQLNVVTAESLTAGMIAKILVDIPSNGATVYGGFIVYDTDAKRKFLGVKSEGVYSHNTAFQMAWGALENSRAMVSIAVTGNAMPTPDDAEHIGNVYIAIGFRKPDQGRKYTIFTKKFNFCEKIPKLCSDWKYLHSRKTSEDRWQFAPMQLTSMISDFIRLSTVKEACNLAVFFINKIDTDNSIKNMRNVSLENWDTYCKPSWILSEHIDNSNDQFTDRECDAYENKNYDANITITKQHSSPNLLTKQIKK